MPDELRRRNVIKISEKGELMWRVSDRKVWSVPKGEKRFSKFRPSSPESIKIWKDAQIKLPFSSISFSSEIQEYIIFGGAGYVFQLNIDTGLVQFLYLDRWG